jgi:hypothetical protein
MLSELVNYKAFINLNDIKVNRIFNTEIYKFLLCRLNYAARINNPRQEFVTFYV